MKRAFPIMTTLVLAALVPSLAAVARADGIDDCERYALVFGKKQGWSETKVKIDRSDSLVDNRFDAKVGTQYVSTEYMGFAELTSPSGKRRARFVCLHEGDGKKAVYFGVFLD